MEKVAKERNLRQFKAVQERLKNLLRSLIMERLTRASGRQNLRLPEGIRTKQNKTTQNENTSEELLGKKESTEKA